MLEGLVLFAMLAPAHLRLFELILPCTQKKGSAFTGSIAGFWQPALCNQYCGRFTEEAYFVLPVVEHPGSQLLVYGFNWQFCSAFLRSKVRNST